MIARKMTFWMLILSFILSLSMVGTAKTDPGLTIYLDPPLVLDLGLGDTFDVYITAREAVNLFLAAIQMSFDPAILQVVDEPPAGVEGINPGDTWPYMEQIWVESVDNTTGWLQVVSGRPVGIKDGLNGTVQLAKITFSVVTNPGSSALHLQDTTLKIVGNVNVDHATEDGFFASSGYSHYAFASDSLGAQQNVFGVGETIYVVGGGFSAKQFVDIYLVPNATWTDGDPIGISVLPVVTVETMHPPDAPHLRFGLPITSLGKPPNDSYDVVVDFDQDGVYDAATDGIDDVTQRPGFTGGRALRGDINQDDTVGSADFSILAGAYGTSVGDPLYDARADIDSNGNVGSSDFSILAGEYGQSA